MFERAVLCALSCAVAIACGKSEPPPSTPPSVPPTSFEYLFPTPGEDGRLACPMGLPGVNLTSIPTDSGSLLVFTSSDGLYAVRERARAFSEEIAGSELAGIEVTTRYDEIPNGAAVEVMADQRRHSLALRDELDRIVSEMRLERDCPEELIALE